MKIHSVRGGIHPDYRKELAAESAIAALPLPSRLLVPLQQHIGAPAAPVVAGGERVRKGQLIARGQGEMSAALHAPSSGTVVGLIETTAPHASGLAQGMIVIDTDGLEEWADLPDPIADPYAADPQAIRERVAAAGIVGMGGATFPAAIKLGLGDTRPLDMLLINGAECEPYLTCDDRLMREYADEVVDGARLMAHALGARRVVIAIEDNKPQAIAAMRQAAAATSAVTVLAVPVRYPMGSERHLTQAVIGLETPAKRLTADLGVVVHNVATARAVYHAVRHGRPLLERVVTVSGGAVRTPRNVEAPLGTPVAALIEFCGGFAAPAARIVNGGPMMGQPLSGLDVPVVKGMSGVLALTDAEVNERPAGPCIRCGACITVCPCGLVPVEMAAYIRKDHFDGAERLGVSDCVSCGSCSYVCPSHIPLVHYFNYAKGMLAEQGRERRKNEQTRQLSEARQTRLERQARAKAQREAEMSA